MITFTIIGAMALLFAITAPLFMIFCAVASDHD